MNSKWKMSLTVIILSLVGVSVKAATRADLHD
jgi:hypothetical protein